MRSVYHANHAFGMNSFMDELALLAKADPLQFHLAALTADTQTLPAEATQEQKDMAYRVGRLKQAIKAVQKASGWPAPVAKSEGWGFAAHRSFDSYVAVASKVSLANDVLRVLEVHIAIDCGQALNPDRVQAQLEGSVIFALTSALMGEISFKDGTTEQSNFHDYPLLRLQQVPKIVVTLATIGEKHGGVGEPGVPPVAASITNAIVAAGGPRIRDLPIQRHLTLA
jgi:isoquinoline 1-oxidoreductase beta subunit